MRISTAKRIVEEWNISCSDLMGAAPKPTERLRDAVRTLEEKKVDFFCEMMKVVFPRRK